MKRFQTRNLSRHTKRNISYNSTKDQIPNNKTQMNFRTVYNNKNNRKSSQKHTLISKTDSIDFPKHLRLTSTNWCLYDSNSSYFLGYREETQRQVASLTKIMTTILTIQLIQKYQLDKNLLVKVSKISANQIGTSANLKEGKWIKLYDLLYGTMLPSGNDAAYLLAEVLGLLLFYESAKIDDKQYCQIECIDVTCYENTWSFVDRFVKEMNKRGKQIKLKKTLFANPHGLINVLNISTAKDIMRLSKYALANLEFRTVVNSQFFIAQIYTDDQQEIYQRRGWKNTNKLLGRGWQGVKTGQTIPAGSCLASYRDGIFIVLLNCLDNQARFQDTITLFEWYYQKFDRVSQTEKNID